MFICQVIRCNKIRTNKLLAMSTVLALYTPIIHCRNISVQCLFMIVFSWQRMCSELQLSDLLGSF